MAGRFLVVGTPDRWALARSLMDEPSQRSPVAFFVRRPKDSRNHSFELAVFVEGISHGEFNVLQVRGTVSMALKRHVSVGTKVVFRVVIPSGEGEMIVVE